MIEVLAEHYISSVPVKDLISQLDPPPPDEAVQAAHNLKHGAFATVRLIVDRADLFPDHWIYVHNPDLIVGRIQNFSPGGRSTLRFAAQEISQQLIELLWPLHLGQMATVLYYAHLRVGYQLVSSIGVGDRHQGIVAAPDDKRWGSHMSQPAMEVAKELLSLTA